MTRFNAHAVRAYIGIGSYLDYPARQVSEAMDALAEIPRTRLAARSSLYLSAPVDGTAQPDYVNAVVAIDTELSPHALLQTLQDIEVRHGRVRGPRRWGPRTLDLDLLLYGDCSIEDETMSVPHPSIHERAFVLFPLHEIAPMVAVPGFGAVSALLAQVPMNGLRRLSGQEVKHGMAGVEIPAGMVVRRS